MSVTCRNFLFVRPTARAEWNSLKGFTLKSKNINARKAMRKNCKTSGKFQLEGFCWWCCSAAQSCPTLCDPMDCSMAGFLVLHHVPELVQTHVHWVGDAIQPSHPVVLFSSRLQSFPATGSFLMSRLFASGGQSIEASALASVLPMNIQGWFPLGLTSLISLQSKGPSRVFSNTTVQKHQLLGAQLSF